MQNSLKRNIIAAVLLLTLTSCTLSSGGLVARGLSGTLKEESEKHDRAIIQAVVFSGNISLCDKLEQDIYMDKCRFQAIFVSGDKSACPGFRDEERQNLCLAAAMRDPFYMNYISNQTMFARQEVDWARSKHVFDCVSDMRYYACYDEADKEGCWKEHARLCENLSGRDLQDCIVEKRTRQCEDTYLVKIWLRDGSFPADAFRRVGLLPYAPLK